MKTVRIEKKRYVLDDFFKVEEAYLIMDAKTIIGIYWLENRLLKN